MIVAVGSRNPAKVDSARLAFSSLWPQQAWDVRDCAVGSGVAAQPMTDAETVRGARNRAVAAIDLARADYGVGIEGGLQETEFGWFNSGWAVVVDRAGLTGIGSTVRMHVPTALMDLVLTGLELGDACDQYFGRVAARRADGFVGLMTGNAIQRAGALRDAVIAALATLRQPG
jgi:inosine/xanthosine triphosphatase